MPYVMKIFLGLTILLAIIMRRYLSIPVEDMAVFMVPAILIYMGFASIKGKHNLWLARLAFLLVLATPVLILMVDVNADTSPDTIVALLLPLMVGSALSVVWAFFDTWKFVSDKLAK